MELRSKTVCLCLVTLVGCQSTATVGLPSTLGEEYSNFGYIPLDPLSVDEVATHDSCVYSDRQRQPQEYREGHVSLTRALPDLSIRYAIAEYSKGGELLYGPVKTTVRNRNYRAVLDYTNVDVVPVEFRISKRVVGSEWLPVSADTGNEAVTAYRAVAVRSGESELVDEKAIVQDVDKFDEITFPVYVGMGLRLSADIKAMKGNLSLSGLSVIGAAADSNNLSGTLTVQAIGVAGPRIANALPLPSKLDQTTVENSILALGTSRALLYADSLDEHYETSEDDKNHPVLMTPRVVGLYSPIGADARLINALYSALSNTSIKWARPCV